MTVEVIDDVAYRNDPEKQARGDRIMASAGYTSANVDRQGIRIEDGTATFRVFLLDEDGKRYAVGDEVASTVVSVPVPD